MTDQVELLVGTEKGLFVLRGQRGGAMSIAARHFPGVTVEFATRDPRTGVYYASVTNAHFGPRVWMTKDVEGEWEQTAGPKFPEDAGEAVERIWVIVPGEGEGVVWAGVAPAALFRSDDGGRTWELNRALWDHPSRTEWQPGAGGMCMHSICPWPGEPDKLALGISAAGVWLTEDGGSSWRRGVKGIVPRYLPEGVQEDAADLCVHNMYRAPLKPERLWMQFHGGIYRSDDAGESWNDVGSTGGLPSDFGFPMVIDPRDPSKAWVIPLEADVDRVTPDGKLRVFETADEGATWTSRSNGLPQEDTYVTILRQAFCSDGRDPLGLYFGDKSGTVYGSADAGATWTAVAERLPTIVSVRAS